jgi:hypothetical protein
MQRIDLSTFRGLVERNHELACFCPGCRRWATSDLAMLVRNGLGDRHMPEVRESCGMASAPADADLYRRDLDAIKKLRRDAGVSNVPLRLGV